MFDDRSRGRFDVALVSGRCRAIRPVDCHTCRLRQFSVGLPRHLHLAFVDVEAWEFMTGKKLRWRFNWPLFVGACGAGGLAATWLLAAGPLLIGAVRRWSYCSLGKRSRVAGTIVLCVGLPLGITAAYFGLRSEPVPEPSEQDARTDFVALLAEAGVDGQVSQFRRKAWLRDTIRFEVASVGGGRSETRPLAKTYEIYQAAYEAELAFRGDCRIRENFVLMWSPANSVSAGDGMMMTHEMKSFQKGERIRIQGKLHYRLRGNQWEIWSADKIDAGN